MESSLFKQQLDAIDDVSLEGLTNDAFMQKSDACVADLDELETEIDKITYLDGVVDQIRLKGVTPAILEDNKARLWSEFEFDLDPFVNAGNEQLTYCIEGLGSTIREILMKIKRVLLRIAEWFSTESLFKYWLNRMELYKRIVSDLSVKYNDYAGRVDFRKFNQQELVTLDYNAYMKRMQGVSHLISRLLTISVPSDILGDNIYQEFHTMAEKCGYHIVGSTITDTGVVRPRRDIAVRLDWTPTKIMAIQKSLKSEILDNGLKLGKLKYALERAIMDGTRTIDQLLKQGGGVNQADVDKLNSVKYACVLMRNLVKLIMQLSSGLALWWINMINTFPKNYAKSAI